MFYETRSAYWFSYILNKFQPWTEEENDWLKKPAKPVEKT